MSNTNNRPAYRVVVPRESKDGQTFYHRIGVAFAIKNGGLSLRLDALPLGDQLLLFPYEEKPEIDAK